MDKIINKLNSEEKQMVRNNDNKIAAVKGVTVIIICILLMLAVKFGIQFQEENYYNVVCIEGIEYRSDNHDIEIDDGRYVIIDGKYYGWSWVSYIKMHQRKENKK